MSGGIGCAFIGCPGRRVTQMIVSVPVAIRSSSRRQQAGVADGFFFDRGDADGNVEFVFETQRAMEIEAGGHARKADAGVAASDAQPRLAP